MVIIVKHRTGEAQVDNLVKWLEDKNLRVQKTVGEFQTILGLIGDTSKLDEDVIRSMGIVEDLRRIQKPYKNASRDFHPDDTIVDVNGVKVGGGNFAIIAGPCSVESEEQLSFTAEQVKEFGADMLRGGAFKPRTSPYSFQGMGEEGIQLLLKAKEVTGLPIVTEIMDPEHLPLFKNVDVIQVGARNMQNFELLKKLGKLNKPILLKRGFSSTIEEFLMSAEYIMAGGNGNVILCERGIRTFETYTRNTLDLLAVSVLKQLTHLPVIVDPSHATGIAQYVAPMSLASAAAGADGLIIEVHHDPAHALCDGPQSLTPLQFKELRGKVDKVLAAVK
ncbi:MAG: 3-deoxy-7-phosphoheptulonate synthase [Oscillospiraceae bacterium]|jgi:3-deoxy-7-phosphoheptulonate synthase|nr:3-deoxy-7-phosphoheptulonate synthase [Oscillospiraceae bacterium]